MNFTMEDKVKALRIFKGAEVTNQTRKKYQYFLSGYLRIIGLILIILLVFCLAAFNLKKLKIIEVNNDQTLMTTYLNTDGNKDSFVNRDKNVPLRNSIPYKNFFNYMYSESESFQEKSQSVKQSSYLSRQKRETILEEEIMKDNVRNLEREPLNGNMKDVNISSNDFGPTEVSSFEFDNSNFNGNLDFNNVQDYLNPIEEEINILKSKVRNKRDELTIAKLETDFIKCKNNLTPHSKCLLVYQQIFQIAIVMEDKMFQMKQIFENGKNLLQKFSTDNTFDDSKFEDLNNDMTTSIVMEDEIDKMKQIFENGKNLLQKISTDNTFEDLNNDMTTEQLNLMPVHQDDKILKDLYKFNNDDFIGPPDEDEFIEDSTIISTSENSYTNIKKKQTYTTTEIDFNQSLLAKSSTESIISSSNAPSTIEMLKTDKTEFTPYEVFFQNGENEEKSTTQSKILPTNNRATFGDGATISSTTNSATDFDISTEHNSNANFTDLQTSVEPLLHNYNFLHSSTITNYKETHTETLNTLDGETTVNYFPTESYQQTDPDDSAVVTKTESIIVPILQSTVKTDIFDQYNSNSTKMEQINITTEIMPDSQENMIDSFEKPDSVLKSFKDIQRVASNTELNASIFRNEPVIPSEFWKTKFELAAKKHNNELMEIFDEMEKQNINTFESKINVEPESFIPPSGPLMSLCQMSKQSRNKASSVGDHVNNFPLSGNGHFTNRGWGFPVTGETVKASAQFMFNPSFGMNSVPFCFFATPAFRTINSPFSTSNFAGLPSYNMGMGSGNSGNLGNGIFLVPPGFGTMPHASLGQTGSANGVQANINNIFSKNQLSESSGSATQPFFCTYMQNLHNSQKNLFGNQNLKLRQSIANESLSDIIYASFSGIKSESRAQNVDSHCHKDEMLCLGSNQCILSSKWCDSKVDCLDGSDEAACTCKNRLSSNRICDGYADCPMGEDEIGCFGCDKLMYSCFNNDDEYRKNQLSSVAMCYSFMERCDGVPNCLNGKDERECNLIVDSLDNHLSFTMSYNSGYLYRNYKGQWYPACNNAMKWAKEACSDEMGDLSENPVLTFKKFSNPGPFIEPSIVGNFQFPLFCQKREKNELSNHAVHIKCPKMKCGRATAQSKSMLQIRSRRHINESPRLKRNENDERVVGGIFSKPAEWPYVIGIFRDGNFECGGSIYNEKWIITAAHCAIGFKKHYYEIRAGMLRRSSYSPSTQIIKVIHVIVHSAYNRYSMKNDIAMFKLEEPLRFNRWVKPICMPWKGRTSMGSNWMWGPKKDTLCTAVGWGAIREKGPGSDSLREVVVPIVQQCKDQEDQEADDICAGDLAGGRDACQGDSGGPLFCRSLSDSKEYYLAGVVSHGNGCARPGEFGVYTRVSLYLKWFKEVVNTNHESLTQPIQTCPGYICVWGGKRCISNSKRCDKIVDCLGGEDEVGCINDNNSDEESNLFENDSVGLSIATNSSTTSPHSLSSLPSSVIELLVNNFTTTVLPKSINLATHDESTDTQVKKLVDNNPVKDITSKFVKNENTVQTVIDEIEPIIPVTFPITLTSTTDPSHLSDSTIKLNTKPMQLFTKNVGKFFFDQQPTTPFPISLTTQDIDLKSETEDKKTSTEKISIFEENITTVSPSIGRSLKLNFKCQKISQLIDISRRCDRLNDCEDGTDEINCTCRDYLKGPLNILICDGKTDCEDFTDEDDCGNCSPNEFYCALSKKCIPRANRCDKRNDCEQSEDEIDCFALTNGKMVILGYNKRPLLKNFGLLTQNYGGSWKVVCSQENDLLTNKTKAAVETCSLLGFKGFKFHESFNYKITSTVPIDPEIEVFNKRFMGPDDGSIDHQVIGDAMKTTKRQKYENFALRSNKRPRTENVGVIPDICTALFIECVPQSKELNPLTILKAGPATSSKTLNLQSLHPTIKPHKTPTVLIKPNEPSNIQHHKEILFDSVKHNLTVLVHDKLHHAYETYHWPWLVDVFVNSKLICIGVLVDKFWILVHDNCFINISLTNDFVVAAFGGNKGLIHAKHPQEQIRRINCLKHIQHANVLLLHLEKPVHFSRYVLPTYLPQIHSENNVTFEKSECMAVVHDNFSNMKTIEVTKLKDSTKCSDNGFCYQRINQNENVYADKIIDGTNSSTSINNDFQCPQEKFKDQHQGVIVCQDKYNEGWFPHGIFSFNSNQCNLKKPFGVGTLENVYDEILKTTDSSSCENPVDQPICETFRCSLGKCLRDEEICNGKPDCHDGSDENNNFCQIHNKKCKPWELKCWNGKCVSKSKFCNHFDDCGDLSDEPTICSCLTYLNATDSSKICDGIRNCWDKSDESPGRCKCTPDKFRCGVSNECVPRDFVCDKEVDCPNGEDELYCYGIEVPYLSKYDQSNKPYGYGQVIEQSYGIWHTKCFPRNKPPNSDEIIDICSKLGYSITNKMKYRFIDDFEEDDSKYKSSKSPPISKYRQSSKALIVNKFSPFHLNSNLTLVMKPSRPIAELVAWNKADSDNCFRLEIMCE